MRVIVIAGLLLAGCPSFPKAGPPPGPLSLQAVQVAQTKYPTATAESLESGRQLFLQHCNQCHKFPALGAYSDADWQRIVPRMAGKAQLSPADGDKILTFILSSRAYSSSARTMPTSAPPAISHVAFGR
jgi:cytochrome c5